MMSVKSVFKLGAFSLVCVLSVLSLSSFSIRNFFNKHDSQIGGNGEWVIIFLVFHFHPLTNAFNSSRFLTRLSNRCIYNYWTDSWRDLFSLEICILFGIKSELLTFIFQSDIAGIWAHIKISSFYYKANGLTNWH